MLGTTHNGKNITVIVYKHAKIYTPMSVQTDGKYNMYKCIHERIRDMYKRSTAVRCKAEFVDLLEELDSQSRSVPITQ